MAIQLRQQVRTDARVGTVAIDPSLSIPVSKTLYGLFFEDINFSVDGGLNANLINNYSFSGEYIDRSNGYSRMSAVILKRKAIPVRDDLRHWSIVGGSLTSQQGVGGAAPLARWAKIEINGEAILSNSGFPGPQASMPIRIETDFLFSALVKFEKFEGTLSVLLRSDDGEVVAQSDLPGGNSEWTSLRAVLKTTKTCKAQLEIIVRGVGDIHIDEVQLHSRDTWATGDNRWSQGRMRADLVEALAQLKPSFMRFPGGCITEGVGQGNQYNWKQTVGPLIERQAKFNLWAEGRPNGDYSQSFQIGFYEYFLLCEDLGMEPVPVVWAGLSCQYRSKECVIADTPEFANVVQDAVDLIDWATGDSKTSQWARLRAEAGHPEPFALHYIGIGNENFGDDYLHHFEKIQSAIENLRPDVKFILSAGAFPKGKPYEQSWDFARGKKNVIVDEHSYAAPSWFVAQNNRFDSFVRTGATVMVGEWAAYPIASLGGITGRAKPNMWVSAVAEAAFMTGFERNADIVEMSCYAPLFANVDAKQWKHNLIDFDGFGVHTTANYQVQQLFGAHVGSQSFEVTGTLPKEVFISATGGKDEICVKVVNAGSKLATVTLSLPKSVGVGEVRQLSADRKTQHKVTSHGISQSAASEKRFLITPKNHEVVLELPPLSVTLLKASTNL
jgi:alpha-L-arabinofuranosidase